MSGRFGDGRDSIYGHSDDEDMYEYDHDEDNEDVDDAHTELNTDHDDGHDDHGSSNEGEPTQRDSKWLEQRKVINEGMIRQAVREELLLDYDKAYVPEVDDIDLREVNTLILSFRSIDHIGNLNGFQNLRKLQLDNNMIEKISNIDHLVNLEWLDLSFNFIKEIKGLEKLTKLKDLGLFNNRIINLTGLENLTKLEIQSIGNNQIKDLEQIRYLRILSCLRALNLRGNPISKEDDYTHTVLAYLPELKYFDYQLISTKQVKDAYDKKMEVVLELVHQEQIEKEKNNVFIEKQAYLQKLQSVGLSVLQDLFETLVKKDKEVSRLQILPGYAIIQDQYRNHFDSVVDKLIDECLLQFNLKQKEEEVFAAALATVIEESEGKLLNMKSVYEYELRGVLKLKQGESLLHAKKQAIRLCDDMMDVEMNAVRSISSMIEEYSETYLKMSKNTENSIVTGFSALTDSIKQYEHNLHDHVHTLLDRINRETDGNTGGSNSVSNGATGTTVSSDNGIAAAVAAIQSHGILGLSATNMNPAQWAPELQSILNDKDQLTNAIVSSHDHHYAIMLKAEEEVRNQEESSTETHLKNVQLAECKRYRDRSNDICMICEAFVLKINEEGRAMFNMK